MLVLILIAGISLVVFVLLFLGRYIYFAYHPERRLENLLNPSLITSANDGIDGINGVDGDLNDFGLDGLRGSNGISGLRGPSGARNFNAGVSGIRGLVGKPGPFGSIGLSGEPGLPSNSIITFLERTRSGIGSLPYRFDHGFTIDGVFHTMSAFFIFDELTYFNFQNGLKNRKYKIKDSNLNSTPTPGLLAKKIYSSIRVVIEKKTGTSSGNIADISPPINQTSYLLRYNTDNFDNVPFIEEREIENNREFGLDFSIVPNNDENSFLNFLLFGFANYVCIFNIEPPNEDIIPRIEERYSDTPITFTDSPSFQIEAKGNVRKIVQGEDPANSVYLLSPRLANGRVINKNSSNNKNLWTVEESGRLQEFLDNASLSKISEAFQFLEDDNNTLKEDIKRSRKELLIDRFPNNLDVQNNLRVSLRSSSDSDFDAFVQAQQDFNDGRAEYEDNIDDEIQFGNTAASELTTLYALLNSPPVNFLSLNPSLNAFNTEGNALLTYLSDPGTTFTLTNTSPAEIGALDALVANFNPTRSSLAANLAGPLTTNQIDTLQSYIDDINNNSPGDAAYDAAVISLDTDLIQTVNNGNVGSVVTSLQILVTNFTNARDNFINQYIDNGVPLEDGNLAVLRLALEQAQANAGGGSVYFTRATFVNISMDYPNRNSRLSFPSLLEGSTLYLEFVVKINIENLEKFSYNVYFEGETTLVRAESNSSIRLLSSPPTIDSINTSNDFITADTEEKFIKYRVIVENSSFDFKKVFGRRAILDFTDTRIFIDAFFSTPSFYNTSINFPGLPTEILNLKINNIMNGLFADTALPLTEQQIIDRFAGQNVDEAFEGNNADYNFDPSLTNVIGWDFRAETDVFEVDNNTFIVGYQNPNINSNNPRYQRVYGSRARNGNYFIDIPTVGFEFP